MRQPTPLRRSSSCLPATPTSTVRFPTRQTLPPLTGLPEQLPRDSTLPRPWRLSPRAETTQTSSTKVTAHKGTEATSNDYSFWLKFVYLRTESKTGHSPLQRKYFGTLKNPPPCETSETLRDPPHFVTLRFMSTQRKFSLHKSSLVIKIKANGFVKAIPTAPHTAVRLFTHIFCSPYGTMYLSTNLYGSL